ncbi:MAG: amidohydrolase family protein [Pseudonocardia sp.]|nr:amidohydrolase family protein [Pseudonocardia sp.]
MPTLFRGGAVFDGRRHRPGYSLLVDAGKVVAVLSPASVERLDLSGHDIVDLGGGLVSPGFTDAHCHPIQGGLERRQCDLTGGATREDYLELVAAYAASYDGPWITGGGWMMAAFPGGVPPAADLDSVVPDRPVLLHNRDHHGAWASSRALELAGVTAATPDPADGRIERLPDGSPQGTLH